MEVSIMEDIFELPESTSKRSLIEVLDSTDNKRIFLSSDWHVFKYKYQKGKNLVNTSEIVNWCKNNVKDNDVFMYLGDLCYRYANKEDTEKAKEIYKSLPGIKVLILGNHDIHQGEEFYDDCGFDYVMHEFNYKDQIIFTHRPIDLIPRGLVNGLNIHGHIHELNNDYDFIHPDRNINVYPGNYNNKPVTLDYLLNHINKLTKDNKPNGYTDGLSESAELIHNFLEFNLTGKKYIKSKYLEISDDVYNLSNWNKNRYNILYVTGMSGSGKTTLASDIAKQYNCERVELDYIGYYYINKNKGSGKEAKAKTKLKADCKDAVNFFSPDRDLKYHPNNWSDCVELYKDFLNWFIPAHEGNGKLYVINGYQIIHVLDYKYFEERPIIIKDPNIIKSAIRRTIRQSNPRDYDNIIQWVKGFKSNISFITGDNNINDAKILRNYRKNISKINVTESCVIKENGDHIGNLSKIKREVERIAKEYNSPIKRINITYYDNQDELQSSIEHEFGKTTLGYTVGNNVNIVTGDYYNYQAFGSYEQLLMHECIHAILNAKNPKCSMDFMEGICVYESGQLDAFRELAIEYPDSKFRMYYNNAEQVKDIIKNYGVERVVDIVENGTPIQETKRSEIPDNEFGIPQERKYPLDTEAHVRSAVKMFNYVDPKYEEQLAKNVIKKMKQFGVNDMKIGPQNRLSKYINKKESAKNINLLKDTATLLENFLDNQM
jgi:calcineurin-like phosphoesterase family protein